MMGPGSEPLWNWIEASASYVEWKIVDGTLRHRYMGNNTSSSLYAKLNQPGGTGEIEVSYIGDTACSSLTLPAEIEEAVVAVPAGEHTFEAGSSGSGPWTLYVGIGGETDPCPEDINGDGTVSVDDLLLVIAAWGPCL